jgi:hypothetical protein
MDINTFIKTATNIDADVENIMPSELTLSVDAIIGASVFLILLLVLFFVLFVRTARKISLLQSTFTELNKNIQHSNGKMETLLHQHGAIVDNIKSVELIVSRDVDSLRHELVRQVEKIFDMSNEEFARTTEILIPRLEAYKRLWEVSESITGASGSLDTSQKNSITTDLNAWYFEEGNGLFLSNDASDIFLIAIRSLKNASLKDAKARFSELRVQLKNDIALYDELDNEKILENLTA